MTILSRFEVQMPIPLTYLNTQRTQTWDAVGFLTMVHLSKYNAFDRILLCLNQSAYNAFHLWSNVSTGQLRVMGWQVI